MVHKEVVDYEPNAIALSPDESVVAIGCAGVSLKCPAISYLRDIRFLNLKLIQYDNIVKIFFTFIFVNF